MVVGGLNWGLVGVANIDLIAMILGGIPILQKLIYVLVALAAISEVVTHKNNCKLCIKDGAPQGDSMSASM